MEAENIIIDTDCGIDDALAIMLALSSEHCKVIAITCVFGNTSLDNVCENVKRVITVCDSKHIPIHRGSSGPLIKNNNPETVHGSDGLGNCGHEFPTGGITESDIPAAIALTQLAKKYPKKINLLAIGPLTNIAVAHRVDPAFTSNLKSIVIMGGNYKGIGNTTEVAEFNFYCDPEAANIVLTESQCPLTLVPWETTLEYGIDWGYYKELTQLRSKKGFFFKCITKYAADRGTKKGNNKLCDCDFLAVAAFLYPQCIKSSIKHKTAVECYGMYSTGLTILLRETLHPKTSKNMAEIITHFDMEFVDRLREKFLH